MADHESPRAAEILLVDACQADADLIRAAFQEISAPFRLKVLATGREALQFCRREATDRTQVRPDLMLLDLGLPDMPGLAVLEEMKGDSALRRIPVVALSGTGSREEVSEAYHLGANSFIAKPWDLPGYIRVMKSVEDFWLTVVMLPKS